MKKASYLAAALSLIAFSLMVFVGCAGDQTATASVASTPQPSTAIPSETSVSLITVDQLRDAVQNGTAVTVDVRTAQQYAASHIEGALHIPFAQVVARANELPKDKLVVFYCACPAEESSGGAAQMLASVGITNTAALRGGLQAWADAGLPLAAGS
jgi:rhodanese-related sulfurtransferase